MSVKIPLKGEADITNTISLDYLMFNKTTTRLPESIYVSFRPMFSSSPSSSKVMVDKVGELVDPLDVVLNGSRHIHATWKGVFYSVDTNNGQTLTMNVESLDCSLVSCKLRLFF